MMRRRILDLPKNWMGLLVAITFWCMLWGGVDLKNVLGGVLAAILEWGWEKFAYYQEMSWSFSFIMLAFFIASGAVLCGLLGWAATRALAATGALDSLPAGRDRHPVPAK